MSTIDNIKKAMKDKKLVIGFKETLRLLRKQQISTVVVASNAPENVKEEIENLANIAKIEFVTSEKNNIELGATCRKAFGVMTLSIKK